MHAGDISAQPLQYLNDATLPFEVKMASSISNLLRSWSDTKCEDWTVSTETLLMSDLLNPEWFIRRSEIRISRRGFCFCLEAIATPVRIVFLFLRVVLLVLVVLLFAVTKALSVYFTWLMYMWARFVEEMWHKLVSIGAMVSFPVFLFWYVLTQWKLLLLIGVAVVFIVYAPSSGIQGS
jgi:hypothetical protein